MQSGAKEQRDAGAQSERQTYNVPVSIICD